MQMISKLSPDEILQFKTAVLAEQRAKKTLPGKKQQNGESKVVNRKKIARSISKADHSAGGNYLLHLNAFFAHAQKDPRLMANHFSLYVALFYCWNSHRFQQPFLIYRKLVMRVCKIRSVNTYTQCLKWLHDCGYIDYEPSGVLYEPAKVSMVSLVGKAFFRQRAGIHFNTVGKKKNDTRAVEKIDTRSGIKFDTGNGIKNDTVPVSNLIHNYNNKQINNETESKQAHTQDKFFSNEKKAPAIETVINWFSERGKTHQEARKFFYHYSAINWTLSGQAIADWQAAACKWLEREHTNGNFKPAKLDTNDSKDYSKSL